MSPVARRSSALAVQYLNRARRAPVRSCAGCRLQQRVDGVEPRVQILRSEMRLQRGEHQLDRDEEHRRLQQHVVGDALLEERDEEQDEVTTIVAVDQRSRCFPFGTSQRVHEASPWLMVVAEPWRGAPVAVAPRARRENGDRRPGPPEPGCALFPGARSSHMDRWRPMPKSRPEIAPLRAVMVALVLAAAIMLAPIWAPLVVAAWFADALRPPVQGLSRLLGGRRRGAAAIVVLLVAALLIPFGATALSLIAGVRELAVPVRDALQGQGTLAGALLGGEPATPALGWREWTDLAARHGASTWRTAATIAHASTSAALDGIVFIVALYAITADGDRAYAWMEARLPIPREVLARLAAAFRETGRGLLVGGGGTALVQGTVATIAYLAIGVPRALVLGPLTALCALVPVVGTGIVWVPVAIQLAVTGAYVRASVVVAFGVGVHALIDNLVRPALTRYGRLELPTAVVLVSMLGGAAAIGASGALLGPLLVRLATEALSLARDRRLFYGRRLLCGLRGPAQAVRRPRSARVARFTQSDST